MDIDMCPCHCHYVVLWICSLQEIKLLGSSELSCWILQSTPTCYDDTDVEAVFVVTSVTPWIQVYDTCTSMQEANTLVIELIRDWVHSVILLFPRSSYCKGMSRKEGFKQVSTSSNGEAGFRYLCCWCSQSEVPMTKITFPWKSTRFRGHATRPRPPPGT